MLIKKARLSARIRNKKVALIGAHTAGRLPRFFYIRKGKGTLRNAFTNRYSKVGKRQRLLHGKNETFAKKADIRQKW